MLPELLAGVRGVRASLAAGYLWLFAAYCATASARASDQQSSDLIGDLYALANACPPSVLVVGSAFIAYLVGAASRDLSELIVKHNTVLARRLARALRPPPPPDKAPWWWTTVRRADPAREWASEECATWAGTGNAELSRAGETAVTQICAKTVREVERMLDEHGMTSAALGKAVSPKLFRRGMDPAQKLLRISRALEARRKSGGADDPVVVAAMSREVVGSLVLNQAPPIDEKTSSACRDRPCRGGVGHSLGGCSPVSRARSSPRSARCCLVVNGAASARSVLAPGHTAS